MDGRAPGEVSVAVALRAVQTTTGWPLAGSKAASAIDGWSESDTVSAAPNDGAPPGRIAAMICSACWSSAREIFPQTTSVVPSLLTARSWTAPRVASSLLAPNTPAASLVATRTGKDVTGLPTICDQATVA